MYITLEEYNAMYDVIDASLFNRLEFEARRVMDLHTTGIDNLRKLNHFPPKDEYNALAVKHCQAKIINLLFQIHEAEAAAAMGRGYTETEQGLQCRIISQVKAGNEAISYAETKLANTAIDAAVSDRTARDKLLAETVWDYLRGVEDANGVNLLYMGKYPRRYLL